MKTCWLKQSILLVVLIFCFCSIINAADEQPMQPPAQPPEQPQALTWRSKVKQFREWAGPKIIQFFRAAKTRFGDGWHWTREKASRFKALLKRKFWARPVQELPSECSICQDRLICAQDKHNLVVDLGCLFSLISRPGPIDSEEDRIIVPLHWSPEARPEQLHWVHLSCLAQQYFNRENIEMEVLQTPITHADRVAQAIETYRQNPEMHDIEVADLQLMAEDDVAGQELQEGFAEQNIEEINIKSGALPSYDQCPTCRVKFTDAERLIVEHFLDVTGPRWMREAYSPNWLQAYECHVTQGLINSILPCAQASLQARLQARRDPYQDFCRNHQIRDIYHYASVANQLLTNEIQLAARPALVRRAFNLAEELNNQQRRCVERFNSFNRNWNYPYPFYYLFMKELGPIFKGDAENMVRYCDNMNKIRNSELEEHQLDRQPPIFQIPVLYKFDPDLIGGAGLNPNYAAKKDNLDKYYNLFFCNIFVANNQFSLADLTAVLNNRSVFEKWAFVVRTPVVLGTDNLIADETNDETNDDKKQQLIQQFNQGNKTFIIWIVPTHDEEDPGHNICILIRKNVQQQVEFIIADSLAKNRLKDKILLDYLNAFY
ncbi:MAG: hypothetical protein US49_C0007G0051 [candidate division TM6 bacterium GW2011_GWF2_37_49]|nr:MAG: hypothetical protein US49_C0007G0051 [candidate division TM6 bacterium GW2011_GWF2_37_49]